jgi:hypothetical protein
MLPQSRRLDKRYVNVPAALAFNPCMKYLAAVVLALPWMAIQAAPPPPVWAPAPPPPDLRQAVQQYHPGGAAAPRQLTPAERAELRKQLTDYARPAPTPHPAPQPRR